jgi:uncharacterized protein YbjT (DUF2867 family)
MRVFLAGGSGFIGGHVLRALLERGHTVTCLARGKSLRGLAAIAGVETVAGEFTRPADWRHRVAGHEAVVNAVGIIRERRGASFEAVQTRAPVALFEAAAEAGVRKIVQISALGADDAAASAFHRSKRAADRRLAELGIPYAVLRPSVVYGPGDHSMAFFIRLARLPLTPVPGDGQYRMQPLYVGDLARAVVLAVADGTGDGALDVGGADAVTFDALLDILARRMGKPRGARKLHVPWPLIGTVALLTDVLGGLGPITRDELGMLRRGNTCDNGPFIRRFGFQPLGLEAGLDRRASATAMPAPDHRPPNS